MDSDQPTYRDFARWAQQPLDEIARDCDVQVFRASGPGGQCVNTTDSAVRMTHLPSGLAVTSRESRSQFRNRQLCLQKLRRLFEAKARPPKVRRATKIPRRAKEARLADKRRRAETKAKRRRVEGD
ncbi:peptide chain release factor-like protein [Gordonibacter sp. 28C]|nr:peptide chain release factor-like protein [Gordonibacter sp. 28C]